MGADVNTLGRINDPGCKIPEYHMAQVILRIFHYDYYIYGGAPWRMNVRSGIEEYDLVSRRILQFASDTKTGSVAMVYAYQLLFEMFIDRETGSVANKSYNVNSDYCITRPNTIALLALLVWSYNFALYGPETSIWINPSVDDSQKDLQMQETGTTDVGVKEPMYIEKIREDIRQVENLLNKENVKITVDDDTIPLKENNPKQEYMSDLEVDLCSQHLKRSIELIVSEVFNKKYLA